ncbi:MAG: class C sortase [Streptococcaceae bacterium]|nr:class C sortase [Streptococcaceae bacterium]
MKKKNNLKQLIRRAFLVLVFLVGSLIATYPFYINALNNFLDEERMTYQLKMDKKKELELAEKRQANQVLAKSGFNAGGDPPFNETINDGKSEAYYKEHLIGSVSIPAIKVDIPLYDLTNNYLLSRGATLLSGTSYPTGGSNTHTVISAHSGLPERKLFTDLEEVKLKDIFVLSVYGKKLAYKVDKIEVVKPEETQHLKLEVGRDLATLLTCTPYTINSHRLLVTGHRIPYTQAVSNQVKASKELRNYQNLAILVGVVLIVGLAFLVLIKAVKAYLLANRHFDLSFVRVNDSGERVSGASYQLFTKSGKRPLMRDGKELVATSDENGVVCIEDLPGKFYILQELSPNAAIKLKAGVKKCRQKQMKLYLNKVDQRYFEQPLEG